MFGLVEQAWCRHQSPPKEAQMAVTTENNADATAIRPFKVEISDSAVEDLRARIVGTRLPEKEPVEDSSQGVQLATMQALVGYWGTEYDLRRIETRLNALPQFLTEIDDLDIHTSSTSSRVTRTRCR